RAFRPDRRRPRRAHPARNPNYSAAQPRADRGTRMIWLFAAAAAAKPAALPTANPLQIQQTQPVPQPIAAPPAATYFQLHASWLTHGLAGLFLIAAIGLVVMLAIQTTKQEGLSGTIGGRVESAYS